MTNTITTDDFHKNIKNFLLKHRGEVTNVVLSTFYKEVHEKNQREFDRRYGTLIGQRIQLITQVQKKLLKKQNAFTIAENLEESLDVINPIIHALKNHPDATLEEIYNILYMEQDFDDRCKGRI